MTTEKSLQAQIIRSIGSRPDIRIFRNNVGVGFVGHVENYDRVRAIIMLSKAHQINFGLFPGSPDLIGWQSVTIAPEHVGQRLAVVLGIEVKRPGERAEKHQENFLRVMGDMGGIAGVAHDVEEARGLIYNDI